MDMNTLPIVIAVVLCFGGLTMYMVRATKSTADLFSNYATELKRQIESLPPPAEALRNDIEALRSAVAEHKTRVDQMEITMSEVREASLRYLQRAATRLRRAEELEDSDDDSPALSKEEVQNVLNSTHEEDPDRPYTMEEMAQILRQRGEEAI